MNMSRKGRILVNRLGGLNTAPVFGYNATFGPCEIPLIEAKRVCEGPALYEVMAWDGSLFQPERTVKLDGVRLFWDFQAACRSYYQTRE